MSDKKKTPDSANKTTVVSLGAARTDTGSEHHTQKEDFLHNPDAMMRHITNVASVDSSRADQSPDKPATRVSSLASFRSPSVDSPFVVKRANSEQADASSGDAVGNVRAFPKASDKPRKK